MTALPLIPPTGGAAGVQPQDSANPPMANAGHVSPEAAANAGDASVVPAPVIGHGEFDELLTSLLGDQQTPLIDDAVDQTHTTVILVGDGDQKTDLSLNDAPQPVMHDVDPVLAVAEKVDDLETVPSDKSADVQDTGLLPASVILSTTTTAVFPRAESPSIHVESGASRPFGSHQHSMNSADSPERSLSQNETPTEKSVVDTDVQSAVRLSELTSAEPALTRRTTAGKGPQISEQISTRIVAWVHASTRNNQTEFRMRLEPPELGSVRIQLTSIEEAVSIRIVAANEVSRQIIESQLHDLRQSMEHLGVNLEQCDVTCEDGSQAFWERPILKPVAVPVEETLTKFLDDPELEPMQISGFTEGSRINLLA